MVLSSPITSSDAERTTSVHQRRGSGASVRSGTGTSSGEGERKKRGSFVSHRCAKVAHIIAKRNCSVPKSPKRHSAAMRRRSGADRSGGGGQREGHADLGAPAVAVVDLEALRHLRDQRQPEPEPWTVRARQHPAPLIGHLDDHALGLAAGAPPGGGRPVVGGGGGQDWGRDRLRGGERDGGPRGAPRPRGPRAP